VTPIQLHLPNGQPTDVYFCGTCRRVGTEASALECCASRRCCDCGNPTEFFPACPACISRRKSATELDRFTKAIKLTEWGGPVFCEGYGRNDGFFSSISDLLGGMDDDDTVPAYVWTCTSTQFVSVDVDEIADRLSEQAPENWEPIDLNGVPELTAALEAFCEANRDAVRWDPDYSRCVVLTGGAE